MDVHAGFAIQHTFDAYFSHTFCYRAALERCERTFVYLIRLDALLLSPEAVEIVTPRVHFLDLQGNPVEGMWIRSGKSDSIEQEINYGIHYRHFCASSLYLLFLVVDISFGFADFFFDTLM